MRGGTTSNLNFALIALTCAVLAGCNRISWFGQIDLDGAVTEPDDTGQDAECFSDGPVTYENFAEPFLLAWCTPCHSSTVTGAGRAGAPKYLNLDTYTDAVTYATLIRETAAGDAREMPPAGGPNQLERDLLLEWIDCGTLGSERPDADCANPVPHKGDKTLVSVEAVSDFCDEWSAVDGTLRLAGPEPLEVDCVCEVAGDLDLAYTELPEASLPRLRSVGGAVIISGNESLTSITAPLLGTVGTGNLEIEDNDALVLANFDELEDVTGSLIVRDNPLLETVLLSELETVGVDFTIQDNPALVEIDPYRMETVGADITVSNNDALIDIQVFSTMDWSGGDVVITENDSIPKLDTFGVMQEVGGSIVISDNPAMASMDAFVGLITVGGEIRISRNDSLDSIRGMFSLETVGESFEVSSNAVLTLLGGLDAVREIGLQGDPELGTHELRVESNPLMDTISAFDGTERMGGITIRDNPVLEEFSFQSLIEVDQGISIENNGLPRIADFDALTRIGGLLTIDDNASLTEINTLNVLETVGGIAVRNNDLLANVAEWEAMTQIDNDLTFFNNDALVTIQGGPLLTTIGGSLSIGGHASLTNITGLYALETIGADLIIVDNPVLPNSQATTLDDQVDVGGTTDISGNLE